MYKQNNKDIKWSSLQTFLGMELPIYTKTQLRNLMIEAQQSKTRAKIAITKRIEKEREAKQEDIMRHYDTTIHTPKWYYFKQTQNETNIPGTIMYIVSENGKPDLTNQMQKTDER
jgi:hypothetical protein